MKSELRSIPGVGVNMEARLNRLGYHTLADLCGEDPEEMYRRDEVIHGQHQDRCVLYVYRLAVAFAEGRAIQAEQCKWWNWKDERGSGD